jgi:hypothetical protein
MNPGYDILITDMRRLSAIETAEVIRIRYIDAAARNTKQKAKIWKAICEYVEKKI